MVNRLFYLCTLSLLISISGFTLLNGYGYDWLDLEEDAYPFFEEEEADEDEEIIENDGGINE